MISSTNHKSPHFTEDLETIRSLEGIGSTPIGDTKGGWVSGKSDLRLSSTTNEYLWILCDKCYYSFLFCGIKLAETNWWKHILVVAHSLFHIWYTVCTYTLYVYDRHKVSFESSVLSGKSHWETRLSASLRTESFLEADVIRIFCEYATNASVASSYRKLKWGETGNRGGCCCCCCRYCWSYRWDWADLTNS